MLKAEIKNRILKLSAAYGKEMVELRRKIHSNPETAFNEFETTKLLYNRLNKKGFDKVSRITETGLFAILKGNKGKCVALRADIDALPITENTGLMFASKNPGIMHACGHDAHSAMVYGAALILKELKKELNGSVKFIFQPAEENIRAELQCLSKTEFSKTPKLTRFSGSIYYRANLQAKSDSTPV